MRETLQVTKVNSYNNLNTEQMKCIKSKDGEIRRVSEADADAKVLNYGWVFIPKSEWKTKVRDFNKKIVTETGEVEVDKKLAKRLKLKEKQNS